MHPSGPFRATDAASARRDVEVAPDGDVAGGHVARPRDEHGAVGTLRNDAAVGSVAGVVVAEPRRRIRMMLLLKKNEKKEMNG